MITVTQEDLFQLYVLDNKPMHIVADELGISVGSVFKYLKLYNISTREAHKGFKGKCHSEETKIRISKVHLGKTISSETKAKISTSCKSGGIGHKKLRSDGYIAIYFPDHPCANKDGYIMEHILVMEAIIGRHLKEDECVHHINEIKNDNRKENLMLLTKTEHMSYHSNRRWKNRKVE